MTDPTSGRHLGKSGLVYGGAARSRFWWGWVLALVFTGLLVVLVTLPPFVGASARSLIMTGFSGVCHQLPDRSPHIAGVALAVCHRCYGIYWGLFLAVLGFLVMYRWDAFLYRRAPVVLAASLVPLSVDWLGDVLGFWTNTPHSRLLTGLVFGIVAGYFVARGVIETLLSGAARVRVPPEQEA
ncbi:DUF2085 domain-containing protein [Rhodocaloribacter sp.]